MSVAVDIAEAVKDALNAATFSQAFTATRQYRPAFELKDMATLHVTVVPHAVDVQSLSRTKQQYDVQVHVAAQKKLSAGFMRHRRLLPKRKKRLQRA